MINTRVELFITIAFNLCNFLTFNSFLSERSKIYELIFSLRNLRRIEIGKFWNQRQHLNPLFQLVIRLRRPFHFYKSLFNTKMNSTNDASHHEKWSEPTVDPIKFLIARLDENFSQRTCNNGEIETILSVGRGKNGL